MLQGLKDLALFLLGSFGIFILTCGLMICIVFLVWVIKIEFLWFFGIDIFKKLDEKIINFKIWFVRKFYTKRADVLRINDKGKEENED